MLAWPGCSLQRTALGSATALTKNRKTHHTLATDINTHNPHPPKVFNPGSGATHTEVTGCAAALNELLGRALAARRLGPEDATELTRMLETLMEFAGDVAARLAREGGA